MTKGIKPKSPPLKSLSREVLTKREGEGDVIKSIDDMYITQILQYLLWPIIIIISWIAVWYAVKYFEKKSPDKTPGKNC
jgi:hypothetical protein